VLRQVQPTFKTEGRINILLQSKHVYKYYITRYAKSIRHARLYFTVNAQKFDTYFFSLLVRNSTKKFKYHICFGHLTWEN